ncbi:DUF4474 domain-containing protein [Lachnospiraceae bacterium ZAX-1]
MDYQVIVFGVIVFLMGLMAGVLGWHRVETGKRRRKPVHLKEQDDKEKVEQLNQLIEPLGFTYDAIQDIFYSRKDSWQRRFGYGRIYDEASAPLNMIIDCEPIYFEYDGKKWMIEFWKGQYGITTGAEVGIYYTKKDEAAINGLFHDLIYKCVEDEDTLQMQMVLWKGNRRLFYRKGYHWWLTGFMLGEYSSAKELKLEIEITLKDTQMRDAFMKGLHEAGYRNKDINAYENTVYVCFKEPYSDQPFTKSRLISFMKQLENKRNCRMYRKVTKEYINSYDKLQALKVREPNLYDLLERMGKGKHFLRKHFAQEKSDEPL